MKRSSGLVVICILLLGLAYIASKTFSPNAASPETSTEEPSTQQDTPSVVASPPPFSEKSLSKTTELRASSTDPHGSQDQRRDTKPEGNVIEFEVVDGWAVGYGDLLLGKPVDGTSILKGYTETADPRTWESPEIPYAIHSQLPDPSRVERALAYLRANSPVNFIPAPAGTKDLIVFEPGSENCYSYLGKVGGAQPIRLSSGCGWVEILHEIMHALGFPHEQSRTDRFRYVEILWENIDPKHHIQFSIVPDSFMENVRDSAFDYRSLMLYEPSSFAVRQDLPSMRTRSDETIAPTRNGLSAGDLRRLKRLYRAE